MDPVTLSVDVLLQSIIGASDYAEQLIAEARTGKVYFVVQEFALYCALYSVREDDSKTMRYLAELLKYSQIEQDMPAYIGVEARSSWAPTSDEIEHWRAVALG